MIWLEQKAEQPELAIPMRSGSRTKGKEALCGQLRLPESLCRSLPVLGRERTVPSPTAAPWRMELARQLRIPPSLLFPHLLGLHLAQGTRVMSPAQPGPLELPGDTNRVQHSQRGTWGHEEGCWAGPGSMADISETLGPAGAQRCIYSMGKERISHSYKALKAGQSVNYPEFTGCASLDRDKPLQKPFSPSSF